MDIRKKLTIATKHFNYIVHDFLVILYVAASKATSTESFIYHLAPVLVEKWYGSYLLQIRDSHAIWSLVKNVQQLCYSRLAPVDHKNIIASP